MLFSIFDVLRIFEALQIFFYKFLLKWGKNEEDFESSIFFEAQKYYFVFESRLNFFSNGHIRNVVSTLPNVVKINVEIHTVVSTLLNVVNFNGDVHKVISTLIWRCATSRRYINLKTTLNRRWNVCWGGPALFSYNLVLLIVIDQLAIIEYAMLARKLSFCVPPSTLEEHIYRVSVILRKGVLQISLAGCFF